MAYFTEELSKGAIRENGIWSPFSYNLVYAPPLIVERNTFFDLHKSSGRNGISYLGLLESFEIGLIEDKYNINVSELENEEAILAIEIASRKYLKDIDIAMKGYALDLKRKDLDKITRLTDAKYDDVVADRDRVQTKLKEADAIRSRMTFRIKELEISIKLEKLNSAYADIDVLEKQLQLSRASIDIYAAITKYYQLEAEYNDILLKFYGLGLESAKLQYDISNNKHELIKRTILSRNDTDIKELQDETFTMNSNTLEERKLAEHSDNMEIILKEDAEVDTFIQNYGNGLEYSIGFEEALQSEKISDLAYDLSKINASVERENSRDERRRATWDVAKSHLIKMEETYTKGIHDARKEIARLTKEFAIERAEILAKATITNTVNHEITTDPPEGY